MSLFKCDRTDCDICEVHHDTEPPGTTSEELYGEAAGERLIAPKLSPDQVVQLPQSFSTTPGKAAPAPETTETSDYFTKKNDQNKPRMSLLPFDALVWVAKVLTFGARKYSRNGDCTCHVRAASQFMQESFVAPVMRDGLKPLIPNTPKSNAMQQEPGLKPTQTRSESIKHDVNLRREQTPNVLKTSGPEDFEPGTASPSRTGNSSLREAATSAEVQNDLPSTIATPQGKSEGAFATRATSALDSSNAQTVGSNEHSATCGIHNKVDGAHSWRTIPDAQERYEDALLRHYVPITMGERFDAESGLPHWAHLACDSLFCCALACADLAKNSVELLAWSPPTAKL